MQLRWQHAALALVVFTGACVDTDPTSPTFRTTTPSFAEVTDQTLIRIGVVTAATKVTLGSQGDYTIKNKNSQTVLLTGSNGSVEVTGEGAVKHLRLQVVCGSAANVSARIAAAQAAGYVTHTEFIASANCTRLYLGEFAPAPANTFGARTTFRNTAIANGHAASDSFWREVILSPGSYIVKRGTTTVRTTEPVVVTSSTKFVTINNKVYRNQGEVITSTGGLAGVNELKIEEYLWGVVPLELGPIAFPEYEAQKAQAVAARTYAIKNINKRLSEGFNLLGTTSDQVFGGFSAEHPISTAAVNETRGVVLTDANGKLIDALYSSTSGGHTADNEEAFNSAPVPYLRGVPDAQRGQAFEHVPSLDVFRAHGNATSLRNAKEGDFDSNWGSLHRWTFEWTNQQISDVISAWRQSNVGKVLAINVLERGPSGRVTLIEYVTEVGTFTHTRDAIRVSLRFINKSGAQQNLPSTLFFIEPITDHKTGELDGFRVYGGGFGHGVGMSQTGAVGMAEKKHTFVEILQHYYRDVSLTTWY